MRLAIAPARVRSAKRIDWRREVQMTDWSKCPMVEVVPGKVSGAPVLRGTRLPVSAVTGNYDAFRKRGLPHAKAVVETGECYPEIDVATIEAILEYRSRHELQVQH